MWMIRKCPGAWGRADGQSSNHPSLTGLAPGWLWASCRGCLFLPSYSKQAAAFPWVPGQVVRWELWVRTATHIFPSTNQTDRSCFVKLDLCRKKGTLRKSERDLGDFCPSLCAGKVCGWEKKQGEPQWYSSWFSCCCPETKPEDASDSVAAPSMGMQLFPLVSWVYSFPSTLCTSIISPFCSLTKATFFKREDYYCLRYLWLSQKATAGFREQYATCGICFPSSVLSCLCSQHVFSPSTHAVVQERTPPRFQGH